MNVWINEWMNKLMDGYIDRWMIVPNYPCMYAYAMQYNYHITSYPSKQATIVTALINILIITILII